MNQNLVWFSWVALLLSGAVMITGSSIFLKTGKDIGIFITYAGVMGLALSGFLMAIAYDAFLK